LDSILSGTPILEASGRDDYSNGNGSLMRTLSVALYERVSIENMIKIANSCIIATLFTSIF
jgi:hypothetical protein